MTGIRVRWWTTGVGTPVVALLIMACARPTPLPPDPAVRFVQTAMRNELRQRWLRVDLPAPDTLRLTFQDEGLRKASPDELAVYARAAAARALALLAPPPGILLSGLRVVSVRIERSHRLGPLAWLDKVTSYTLDVQALRPMRGTMPDDALLQPRDRPPNPSV